MPIRVPDSLPAAGVLESENIFVMTQRRALHQDIRPLNLLILNLMPTKIVTETQLLRKLSNTPFRSMSSCSKPGAIPLRIPTWPTCNPSTPPLTRYGTTSLTA